MRTFDLDKPPRILTLRDIERETGIPYNTLWGRRKRGDDLEKNHQEKPLKSLQGKTQTQVAKLLGISRQRVGQRIKAGYVLDGNKWVK